jgi:hypothetical protein
MASEDEPRKQSVISAQLFELLKVVVTLVLTGLIGGGITYYYQNSSHREEQDAQELETARQSALTFLREVGDILEQRRHHAFRVVYAVRDNAPPEEKEQVWKDYTNAVNAWNMKWNLYRALVLEQFGPDMQKRFYDEKADAEGVWEKSSITGKLKVLDDKLTEYHKENPDKPPLDPDQITRLYSSIAQDCYGFYSEVIARIQQGRVGKRSWAEPAATATPNR